MRTSQNKARELQALHLGPSPLLLPNAWDVSSARIFENAGFRAVGTTSAGIAATLGMPDGERVSREEMLAVVAQIVRALSLPVSADIEAGADVKFSALFPRFSVDYACASALRSVVIGYHVLTP